MRHVSGQLPPMYLPLRRHLAERMLALSASMRLPNGLVRSMRAVPSQLQQLWPAVMFRARQPLAETSMSKRKLLKSMQQSLIVCLSVGVASCSSKQDVTKSASPPPARQSARNANVMSLEIAPPNVLARPGQRYFNFVAIAHGPDGTQVTGIPVTWRAHSLDGQGDLPMADGVFVAPSNVSGTVQVVAEANGLSAAAAISNIGGMATGSVDGERGDPFYPTWGDQSPGTGTEALNRRGPQRQNTAVTQSLNSPEAPRHDGAGNGNFRLDIPLLDLPGRGLNASLTLAYNSRVWTLDRQTQKITFDVDADWFSPGWSIGFGKLVNLGSNARLLIDGDGTRHPFDGPYVDGSYRTQDGSLIDYKFDQQSGAWIVKYPNGTTATFGAAGAGAAYPSQIADINGNYISIVYLGAPPFIQYIQDTLGRTISFHYDMTTSPILVTSITAPGFNGGADRTIARFHYRQFPLNFSFFRLQADVRLTATPWLLDAVYFPATATGYLFDSFSCYGMIKKVAQQRGMAFTPGAQPDLMGSVTSGLDSHVWEYSYPSQ